MCVMAIARRVPKVVKRCLSNVSEAYLCMRCVYVCVGQCQCRASVVSVWCQCGVVCVRRCLFSDEDEQLSLSEIGVGASSLCG